MINVSARQWAMLKFFYRHQEISLATVRTLNQMTLWSLWYRKWIAGGWVGAHITDKGREAFESFSSTDFHRKNIKGSLFKRAYSRGRKVA